MKNIFGILFLLLLTPLSIIVSTVHASSETDPIKYTNAWVGRGNTPEEVLGKVVDQANDKLKIQDTKFDSINNKGERGQITGTLERIRRNIQPYLQWILYIGLVSAVILVIWNGFLLVSGTKDMNGVKDNLKSIAIGVIIMSGFVAIIKITLSVVNLLFNT